jgi:hypothetical protein
MLLGALVSATAALLGYNAAQRANDSRSPFPRQSHDLANRDILNSSATSMPLSVNQSSYMDTDVDDMYNDRFWRHYPFIEGSTLPILENQHFEFKVAQGKPRSLTGFFGRYAEAFLNANGGKLFLGIDDEGRVVGLSCDRSRFDHFCLSCDQIAAKDFKPQVDACFYNIERFPVLIKTHDGQFIETGRYVLYISFNSPPNTHIVYSWCGGRPHMRASASVRPMSPEVIQNRLAFGKSTSGGPMIPKLNDASSHNNRQSSLRKAPNTAQSHHKRLEQPKSAQSSRGGPKNRRQQSLRQPQSVNSDHQQQRPRVNNNGGVKNQSVSRPALTQSSAASAPSLRYVGYRSYGKRHDRRRPEHERRAGKNLQNLSEASSSSSSAPVEHLIFPCSLKEYEISRIKH